MNEVFLACMFALNVGALVVTARKVRVWRRLIRDHAAEARVCEKSARAAAQSAREDADRAENTAGRCRQIEIHCEHVARRTEHAARTATGEVVPTPNPAGLRIYGSDESDFRGTD